MCARHDPVFDIDRARDQPPRTKGSGSPERRMDAAGEIQPGIKLPGPAWLTNVEDRQNKHSKTPMK